jgi:hypothetical protein
VSADLIRRWRREAREQEQAAAAVAIGRLSCATDVSDASNLRGYAEALRRCADSLERSLARKRVKVGK